MMLSETEILEASILIVDDQDSNIRLLEQILSERGYSRVASTRNPQEVCALHRKNGYDLILLDLLMPTMDGFQVMAELKLNTSDAYLPVLVFTAHPDHKLRALQAGAKEFISKPFDLVETTTRIRNMLEVRLLYKKLENYNTLLERTVQERTAQLRERVALIAREQMARLEAEAANRAKDVFLAMLSHELRNPLSAITSAIEVLNRIGAKSELEINTRRILRNQTQHLSHMLDDLLDVARVTSGHLALSRRAMDLAARVQHVIGTLEITGQPNEHELTLDLHEVWIDADPTRVEQVVNNLLNNAIKYTPPGGYIKVRVSADGHEALLEVSNSGPGIAADLLPHVFDLFVQGERTLDRRDGGLGVGLALVRRLVELHDGNIHAETTEQGALISVRLPAIAAPPVAEQRPALRASIRRRIAVIEDNEDVLESLQSLLKIDGHTVWTATDGISGLALLLDVCPEVAIVDIGLPGLTGFAVAQRSRAGGFAGKMIALSGYGHAPDMEQALASGFDDYLLKPIDFDKLHDILATETG